MSYRRRLRINELRQQQFEHHKHHDRSPYTWWKARLYMEGASRVVWLLQNTWTHPTTLTLLYGVLGVIGAVLLSTHHKGFILLGLLLFYFKGMLDWADGHLARLTDRVTVTGGKLDRLCGSIGTLSFYCGVTLYILSLLQLPYIIVAFLPILYILWDDLGLPKLTRLGYACVVDAIILIILLSMFIFPTP